MGTSTIRKAVILLILLACLIVLGGCAWWAQVTAPPIVVVASPTAGHPSVADGGLEVSFRCSGGLGEFDFDPGDGGEGLSSNTGWFTHTYETAGTYEAVVSSGGRSKTIAIEVVNRDPWVTIPFTENATACEWMERKLYNTNYQEHGCDGSGASLWAYGAYDPDGDPLAYKWDVLGPGKNGEAVEYSVFDTHILADGDARKSISGEFTRDPLIVFFAGWTQEAPPYDFWVNPLECGPIDPWEPPEPAPGAGVITLTLTVRDAWGGQTTISWTISLSSTGCS